MDLVAVRGVPQRKVPYFTPSQHSSISISNDPRYREGNSEFKGWNRRERNVQAVRRDKCPGEEGNVQARQIESNGKKHPLTDAKRRELIRLTS